jgi:hypothetical protein
MLNYYGKEHKKAGLVENSITENRRISMDE